jgi:periplasmic protein TonB
MTSIRLPISFCLSVCTTVALFWFLGMLTAGVPSGERIPVIRNIAIAPVFVPEPLPVRPEPVRPPTPKPKPSDDFDLIVDTKNVVPGDDRSKLLPPGVGWGEGEISPRPHDESALPHSSGSDRGPVPQIRIEPDYPPQARDRGIEGWVKFQYTVASDGSVKDVAILDSQPPRIWDSATIRAVSTWKYQPALADGRPVEQTGLVAIYRFELD